MVADNAKGQELVNRVHVFRISVAVSIEDLSLLMETRKANGKGVHVMLYERI